MKISSAVSALAGLVAALGAKRMNASVVDIIAWQDTIEWFATRRHLKVGVPDVVAFTYLRRPVTKDTSPYPPLSIEKRSKAQVILVQGFFNQQTQELLDCRVLEANEMDAECRNAHNSNQILIYE